MAVITISRQTGSGGAELAERLAHELDYRLVDKEILAQVAAMAHVPVEEIAEFETTGGTSFLKRFLHAVARGLPNLDDYYQAFARVPPEEEQGLQHYVYYGHEEGPRAITRLRRADCLRFFESAVRELAERGNVVLVGRGGQVLLKDFPHALHLRVVAGEAYRVERVSRSRGLDAEAALAMIRDDDSHRADYLAANYECDVDDPLLYDMVLRMDHLDAERVAGFVREWVIEETKKHKSELEGDR